MIALVTYPIQKSIVVQLGQKSCLCMISLIAYTVIYDINIKRLSYM